MIFANKNTPFQLENSNIEICAITLYLKTEKIRLINCYDPPIHNAERTSTPMTDYEKIIDQISTENYILLGDVNAHNRVWGPTQDTKGKNLTELIFKYDLTILNDGNPTMTEHNTTPDITLATPNLGITSEWHTLDNSCGSDHLPIISHFQVRYNATGTAIPPKWVIDKADWELYKNNYALNN